MSTTDAAVAIPRVNAGWGRWVLLWAWPPIAAILVVLVAWVYWVQPALSQRPPVAVIDVRGSVLGQLSKDPSDAGLKDALAHTADAAARLRAHGYIVFDAANVYAYPDDYKAKP